MYSKVGILSVSYHAGLSVSERTMIQEKWLNGNRCKVRLCVGLEITENSWFKTEFLQLRWNFFAKFDD